jgi:hypothetical protein
VEPHDRIDLNRAHLRALAHDLFMHLAVGRAISRQAALSGSSPSSMPPWGICQALDGMSMRWATKTSERSFSSMMPTPRR